MKRTVLLLALSSSVMLSGCVPLLLGGVAAASYVGVQERGAGTAVSDISLKTMIKDKLTESNYKYLTQVEVSVLRGEVLLTGVVATPRDSADAESIIRGIDGVKAVYNNLFTDGIYPTSTYTQDAWIATQIRSLFIKENRVKSANYQVAVVNGHAYILGLAADVGEMERMRYIARTTKGVVKVYSYISLYSHTPQQAREKTENKKIKSAGALSGYAMPGVESEDIID